MKNENQGNQGTNVTPIEGTSMKDLDTASFIEPTPKPQLDGELGLTLTEVATSLRIQAKTLRQTYRKYLSKDFDSLGLVGVEYSTLNKVSGLEFKEYVFDVPTAKWIVTQSRTQLGKAYCKFLIDLESKVSELDAFVQRNPLAQSMMIQIKILKVQDEHAREIKAIGERQETFIDEFTEFATKSAVATDPQENKELNSAIVRCARRNGGVKLCGHIRNVLKQEFGHGAGNVRLQDQINLAQMGEIEEYLRTYKVPRIKRQRYYPEMGEL